MFIAPTEPRELKAIGVSSLLPEKYGVDILWESELGLVGIQRKTFPDDFLASVSDGRLNREYPMMTPLAHAVLMLEGRQLWTHDGALVRDNSNNRWPWDREKHRNYLSSVHLRGVQVLTTDSLQDSIEAIHGMRAWSEKADHLSLHTRPGPPKDLWGTLANRDYALHFLQGIPDIGPKVAGAIYDHFGRVPLALGVSERDLQLVPGVGPKLARRIAAMFEEAVHEGEMPMV